MKAQFLWIALPVIALAPGCFDDNSSGLFSGDTEETGGNGGGGSGGSGGGGSSDSGNGDGDADGGSANGGAGATGGSGGQPIECGDGEKSCNGACVDSTIPENGCATDSCSPCFSEDSNVATAACTSDGKCASPVCKSGWADCEVDASGCESSVSSQNSCSGCAKSCRAPGFSTGNAQCNTGGGATLCFCEGKDCKKGEYCRKRQSTDEATCTCNGTDSGCPDGHGCCGGQCTPICTSDNCGSCGNVCPSSQNCRGWGNFCSCQGW
ncbi:MAG: hypothetical protein FWD57_02665 [Polyangiaceae bacterium]|nr:hypothetical protein [Polyangiaceae bacterium]